MRVIVLEGVNTAGKSSIGLLVKEALLAVGSVCVLVDPAGFGPAGKLLRNLIVQTDFIANPNLDAILFTALRAEGVQKILESAQLDPSTIVLLERYSLALASYGAADGAGPKLISELRTFLQSILKVDATILLDIDGEVAFQRVTRTGNRNRFELRGQRYLDDVARWYRHFAREQDQTEIIDASSDIVTTCEKLRAALASRWTEFQDIRFPPGTDSKPPGVSANK